jgi:hypothetical protein
MKNFMPNLSQKSSTFFTFPKMSAPTPLRSHPRGKLASFIFFGLKSWSEQGTLIVTYIFLERKREKQRRQT